MVNNIKDFKTMKIFKIKNYKGNLVESLKNFSNSHNGMKIVEVKEVKDGLKILIEEISNVYELADYDLSELDSNDKKRIEDEIKNWIDEKNYSVTEIKEILKNSETEKEELFKMGSWVGFTGDDDMNWDDVPESTYNFIHNVFIKYIEQKLSSARKDDGLEDFVEYMFKLTRIPSGDIREMAHILRKNTKYTVKVN